MFKKLQTRLATERAHFDNLGDVVKHLLLSYSLYLISYPVIGIFINAYFWRQSSDVSLMAAYNLGFFVALPIGFYLNGLLLKTIKILNLYWIGGVLQGVAAFLAIFIPDLSFYRVLFYGLIYGIGGGIYWANKNYITLKITKGRNRIYYNNLESSLDLIINMIMPLIIGWFIVFGENMSLYSVEVAYKILMFIALGMLAYSGYVLKDADIYSKQIDHIMLQRPSRAWNMNRILQTIYWTLGGVNAYIPSLLVLMFVGQEGVLGTIESITSLIVAMMLYVVGRKIKSHHTLGIITISSLVFFFGAIMLYFYYGLIGALIYTVVCSLTGSPSWNTIYSNTMEVMDKEKELNPNLHQYSLVFDNEIFFNTGRVLGMFLFFAIARYTTTELSLRTTPLIIAILQFVALVPLSYLLKYVSSNKDITSSV